MFIMVNHTEETYINPCMLKGKCSDSSLTLFYSHLLEKSNMKYSSTETSKNIIFKIKYT